MTARRTSRHRPLVLAATLTAFALIAQQVAAKAVRDALFLSSFNVRALPSVMSASAVLAMVAVLLLARALAVSSPARIMPRAVAASVLLLLAEWSLALAWPRPAALAVYAHVAVFGAALVSGFWSVVNERFDPYTAKKAMGAIGTGASLGGVAGGALAWLASGLVPLPSMLALLALANVLCFVGLVRLRRDAPSPGAVAHEPARHSSSGLRILRKAPYLRDLALLVAVGALIEALLDYVLNAKAFAAFAGGQELVSFFALFHGGVSLAAFAVQSSLTRRSLQRFGLAGSVAVQPAVVAAAGLVALASPRLWTAVLVRGSQAVIHNSLFRSGYELFYTPVPQERKRPTKAIVDVGFDKLGTVAGGLVALLAVSIAPRASAHVLLAVSVAAALAALAICYRLHRGYVAALEESLRSGAVRLELGEVEDSTTRFTLAHTSLSLDRDTLLAQVRQLRGEHPARRAEASESDASQPPPDSLLQQTAALHSGEPELVRRTLAASETVDPRLVPHLIRLLGRNDVLLDVLHALRRLAPRITGQLLDALLDPDQDPAVRRRIPRVLKACATQRAVDGLVLALQDPSFAVRHQCGLALAKLRERPAPLTLNAGTVFSAVLEELKRDERDVSLERRLEHVFTLLSLVLEREPLQISFWALRSEQAIRGTALEYLENVLPDRVRDALWPLLRAQRRTAEAAARSPDELRAELLRSGETLAVDRRMLRSKTRRPGP